MSNASHEDIKKLKRINAIATCAFQCARNGYAQDLKICINKLLHLGMNIKEIQETIFMKKLERHSLFLSIGHSLLFSIVTEDILIDIDFFYYYNDGVEIKVLGPFYLDSMGVFFDTINEKNGEIIQHKIHAKPIYSQNKAILHQGQFECLQLLHQLGFNLMEYNYRGQLLIHFCERIEIMKYFIENGINVDTPCKQSFDIFPASFGFKRNALSNSISRKTEESFQYAKYLISMGADIHVNDTFIEPNGVLPMYYPKCDLINPGTEDKTRWSPRVMTMLERFLEYFYFCPIHLDFFKFLVKHGMSLRTLTPSEIIERGIGNHILARKIISDEEQSHIAMHFLDVLVEEGFDIFESSLFGLFNPYLKKTVKASKNCLLLLFNLLLDRYLCAKKVHDSKKFLEEMQLLIPIIVRSESHGGDVTINLNLMTVQELDFCDQIINLILKKHAQDYAQMSLIHDLVAQKVISCEPYLPPELKAYILYWFYVPQDSLFMRNLKKSIQNRETRVFKIWCNILISLCYPEIEKKITVKHISDLIRENIDEESLVSGKNMNNLLPLIEMTIIIGKYYPDSCNIIWKVIPLTIKYCKFNLFSNCVKDILIKGTYFNDPNYHDTSIVHLKKLINKFKTIAPDNSKKKERRKYGKMYEPFYHLIKDLDKIKIITFQIKNVI